jgi:hypothetical protein
MDSGDIITALLAMYGAILSTIVAIRDWRARRPKIAVKTSWGLLDLGRGNTSDAMLFVQATNPGQKPVTLSSVGFVLPSQERVFLKEPHGSMRIPCELASESACQVWIGAGELAQLLRSHGFSGTLRLIGFYNDQVGRTHKSKPFKFDVDEWA